MSAIERLLSPRSIAVVGASQREEATGTRVVKNLQVMGYEGRILPVNPRYEEILGLPCYPSLSELPEPPDAAFLAVPATAGPDLVEEAAKLGIKALFLNANGYADGDADGVALQQRIEAVARAEGIAISGPNNIGLVNVHDRAAIWTPRYMTPIRPGPVAVISQSGSVAIILSEDERKLGLAYVITAGNEAVVGVADYLASVAADPRVSVIMLFVETIREPERFAAAARAAAAAGKRVIAVKLGSSEGGRVAVQAHTGGLAGDDKLYDAYFAALGIIRVHDLDEMLETATLLAANPAPPPTPNTVVVTLSGGEAALFADLGHDMGLPYPPLAPETLAALRPAFPPYSRIGNPLDAWGLGFNAERFRLQMEALAADPSVGIVAVSVDAPGQGGGDVPYAIIMGEICGSIPTDKRFCFINNTSGTGVNAEVRAVLDTAGIAYLSGMRPALAAIRALRTPLAREIAPAPALPPLPEDEPSRFAFLREAGVPMVRAGKAADADQAVALAGAYGYPVVLKGIAPSLPHKTELGLVKLGLGDEAGVRAAFAELSAILAANGAGPDAMVVVQAMASPGVELILGIRNEPGFGSFTLAGPGGVLVEVTAQSSLRMGPVDEEMARRMLDETVAGTLLRGVRGKGPFDFDAAARAIARLSEVGAALADRFAAIEINPLIVGPDGVAGVDVLFETHTGKA
ncbi:acetate--CoA ligase family protein [Ancylobacter mangrovi]|uniref:acetate--CoA ligase family protein n=1 Tax=Ancylobacter mangrovi TaxID=2972472 RepID=UPI002162DE25|nr:acetate--CoA ligase family protein [Ancylobacter mangrovi]MCS0502174.1 acetate--CoA ligase family protein [Ancylobacter mangrovi]